MRRIRVSTWVLTAIFLAALVAYVFLKPSSASTDGQQQRASRQTHSTSPAPSPLFPGMNPGATPHSSPPVNASG